MTHALLTGSPAIDRGDLAALPGSGMVPLHDQRGAPLTRRFDGDGAGGARIDMGAFELQTLASSADFDLDLDVDGFDFLAWQRGFGLAVGATRGQGNADGDGDVDGEDLTVWKAQFGNPALVAAGLPAASAALVASDAPSRLSPQAVDAAMAWQMAAEARASRPLFRPRWLRAR